MWGLCRLRWPAATAQESTNWLMDKLRKMLDDLLEDLEAERPDDPELEESLRMHEAALAEEEGERLREVAEDNEEMFAGVAEDEVDADEQ